MSKSNWLFQSTPANFTAGDPSPLPAFFIATLFQSTPANFTAGDDAVPHDGQRLHAVSIHARQFHSGRPPVYSIAASAARRFNPRPPISQRATPVSEGLRKTIGVSIHARQFHSGRRDCGQSGALAGNVSIHARQFHSGRQTRRA